MSLQAILNVQGPKDRGWREREGKVGGLWAVNSENSQRCGPVLPPADPAWHMMWAPHPLKGPSFRYYSADLDLIANMDSAYSLYYCTTFYQPKA